jgi:hypothetical protein
VFAAIGVLGTVLKTHSFPAWSWRSMHFNLNDSR